MSIPQTSRIHDIDVGTPPPSLSKYNKWEMIHVRYHDFEHLTTTRGQSVHSPEFTCFGRQWCLRVYPGGRTDSDDGVVSISLRNMSNQSIKVQFGFSVKNESLKSKIEFVSNKKGRVLAPFESVDESEDDITLFEIVDSFEHKRSQIIENLVDGTFIIKVRMRQVYKLSNRSQFIPENPLVKTILNMFNDENSSDVKFEVRKEEGDTAITTFNAHRIFLQTCGPSTLLGELINLVGDPISIVSITGVTPEIFRHLLYYLYGGKIAAEELESNAKEIIDAANKYGIVGLKLEAEAAFVTSTTITFDNAIDNLLYADSTDCALIKEAVMDFLVENSEEAVTKLSFENIPGQVIKDVLAAVSRGKYQGRSSTDANDFSTMSVSTLRQLLDEKGLDVDGSREAMIARLEQSA